MKNSLKKFAFLTIIITIIICINTPIFAQPKPEIIGQNVLLVEQTTDSVIYSKNSKDKIFPASTTKMVTALVTLDYFDRSDIITIGEEINNLPSNSSTAVGIEVGQTLTIENALRGLLLSSGNDVACSLALNIVQKKENKTDITYEEAEKLFAEIMNEKVKSLGAINSNFVNPHGYHNENHYSTAEDLFIIAKSLLANETLKNIVMSPSFTGVGADKNLYPDKKIVTYSWKNSNLLISSNTYKYEYATGIKTGSTDEAGKCLVASAEKNGKKLIAVVLNSTEAGRWQDAIKLFNYGFNNFEFALIQKQGDLIDNVLIRDDKFKLNTKIDIIADKDMNAFVPLDKLDLKVIQVEYNNNINISSQGQKPRLALPLKAGQVIGTVTYKIDDEPVLKTEIKAPSDIDINLINNSEVYKKASKEKKIKDIISFIIKSIIVIICLIFAFFVFRIIRIRLIRRRRRMRMQMRKRRNARKK